MAEDSWATSSATRKSMQANKSRDTKPELLLRRALHAMGLRYRVCARPLPDVRRTADIVFRSAKVAVEVRGCFWHGCPEHYRAPTANSGYWAQKVERNMARDADTAHRLTEAGWSLTVVWEHEDLAAAAEIIAAHVRERRVSSPVGDNPAGG
ncbi:MULTISPECIES: very short patch repair endonuclease [Actinosynnema]|uniref:very short patch repair endonuclease n=1 Tax=Actinosynnema TaxID=40566 RepID=UPI0020A46CEA|nr:very short patch repair endonuclease [Actinosynnema pretiosum]MCP2096763.1 T/G mismatch-specific endonuclease [Actinosynnema pretiosum]